MSLKQNTTILCQLPLRQIGGDPGSLRSMWGRTDLRNQSAGQGISSKLAAIPYGHLDPSAWVMPYKSGAMSAFTYVGARFTANPINLAAGVNISGNSSVAFIAGPSLLQLIVSLVGNCTFTFTVNPATLPGVLNASGNADNVFTVGPSSIGAITDLTGSLVVTFTDSGTATAIGVLAGDITPYTELSPETLAAAVIAASQTTPIVADAKNVVGNYQDQWKIRSNYRNRSRN